MQKYNIYLENTTYTAYIFVVANKYIIEITNRPHRHSAVYVTVNKQHFMIDITENENPFHGLPPTFHQRKKIQLINERFERYYVDCYNPLKNKPWNKHNLQI